MLLDFLASGVNFFKICSLGRMCTVTDIPKFTTFQMSSATDVQQEVGLHSAKKIKKILVLFPACNFQFEKLLNHLSTTNSLRKTGNEQLQPLRV